MDTRKPILKSCEKLAFSPGLAAIERNGRRIELGTPGAASWREVFEQLDGSNTLSDIAKRCSISEPVIAELVDTLHEENVVGFEGDDRMLSGEAYWKLHGEYCRGWLDRIAGHPIWPSLTEGKADRAVAIGFVIEKYHYIEGAYEHMAIAAAYADPRISSDLTKHFMEEYNHGDIYLGGLSSLFPKKSVVESLPLPSTRALLNCLNELALSDSFAYYSANEFLQKTENVGEGLEDPVERFYEAIERNYNLPPAVCRSMRAHTAQDQTLGHQDVFAQMCAKLGRIPASVANKYLGATRRIVEHLEYFLDGIQTYYTRFPYVPRPRATLTSE